MQQCVKTLLRQCVPVRSLPESHTEHQTLHHYQRSESLKLQPLLTITGVDFTGALFVKEGVQEKKVYICLFTCATTRAVHLEVVSDLTVGTFLLAFRRFSSRKFLPRKR